MTKVLPQPGEVWTNPVLGTRWRVVEKLGGSKIKVQAKDKNDRRFVGVMDDWELAAIAHKEVKR